ncbi:sepiapterin reductase-like [Teleopsis dalmanni]|uniref:sepiapterin reductase-like n=1 Tax=Teleopsis dalmanni TaxID=139649 RepID=UPI0018CCBFA6|nr:sepiapterin reductase-like [Teleopsis dalmanni]XP_037929614.1 sepiapterin reductase-like [Teleopsis dalmanni]XP_037937779.1 sepiapterin reductase-like [Teleopsis dalmanni]XP_037937780.1 sepiapterin reductase-like [Teleopsis dalmanni]XP_037937796.1 sepiapterin reductase-like [Teleopsis dalmanni]
MVLDLEQKTYFLITGASRGIGQTMAIQIAAKLKAGSVVVLLARSVDGLNKTKLAIEALKKDLKVCIFSIDLTKAKESEFEEILHHSLSDSDEEGKNFERAFIIHNAGSVGDVSKRAVDVSDTSAWTEYYHLNLFSTVSLNCEFYRKFIGVPKLVVNLSSKCGIEPFASMSFYCSGKAARDMYFRVLAVEETKDSIVLNYAPGAIDTDMTELVQKETINEDLSAAFKQQRDTKTMLTTTETTAKFISILESGNFNSGDHVDYWD